MQMVNVNNRESGVLESLAPAGSSVKEPVDVAQAVQATAIVDEDALRGKIHVIRGQKVMLDFELAEIYGYSTKAFNQQVRRNIEKFEGDDFMFRLLPEEVVAVRSQIVTSRQQGYFSGQAGGTRHLPYAFTEQGVYMLMTVLKGELATRQSRALIRLFKQMKDHVIENQGLVGRREFLALSAQVTDSISDMTSLRISIGRVEDEVASVVDELADKVSHSELSQIMLDSSQLSLKIRAWGRYLAGLFWIWPYMAFVCESDSASFLIEPPCAVVRARARGGRRRAACFLRRDAWPEVLCMLRAPQTQAIYQLTREIRQFRIFLHTQTSARY